MRTFELSTRLTAVSRASSKKYPNGRRTTAMAAYRAGCAMSDDLTGGAWDYRPKSKGVAHSQIYTVGNPPAWMQDRQKFWNMVEAAEERYPVKKLTAQPAKEIMFTFANELSPEGREIVLKEVAGFLLGQGAAAVDGNIHSPGKQGDSRNWHAHVMFPTRLFDGEKFIKKAPWQASRKEGQVFTKALRKFIADRQNHQLEIEGHGGRVFVEHRSFKARGSSQTPTRHVGVAKTNAIRTAHQIDVREWIQTKKAKQRQRHMGSAPAGGRMTP